MPRYRLKVIAGQQKGAVWELAQGRYSLGRDTECAIVVNDESASRRHAEVLVSADTISIHDVDSTNHTFVNERQIDNAVLSDGDVFQIGSTRVKVEALTVPTPDAKGRPIVADRTPSDVATDKPITGSQSRGRSIALIVGAGTIGLVVAVVIALGGRDERPQPLTTARGEVVVPDGSGAKERRIGSEVPLADLTADQRQMYEKALTFLEYGNLVRARASFQIVIANYPGFRPAEINLDRTNDLLNERINRAFVQTHSALEAGRYDEARRAIESIIFFTVAGDPRREEAEALAKEIPQR